MELGVFLRASRGMLKSVRIRLFFILYFAFQFAHAQSSSALNTLAAAADKPVYEEVEEGGGTTVKILSAEPNKKRIRRHLNLIAGMKHDEEISIPEIPLTYKGGGVELIDLQRIKNTDTFRILPTKIGNGIVTIHNKKTGQILVELRIDIRDQTIEKMLRETQALLNDIEGIEYKIVNGKIILDGFVLLPKDLKRIGQVITQFGGVVVSLVGLSPLAKKKIVEYIARDINNPEITVTSIGDFIRLEGFVNSIEEKNRINDVVLLYLPDIVQDTGFEATLATSVKIVDRKPQTDIGAYVINLIQVRKAEDKVTPPPKMIQVVIHVVEYAERYLRNFNFTFSPSLRGLGESQTQGQANAPGSISELASIVDNLLPKLNWARTHGYVRLLDTASLLTQDKNPSASLSRTFGLNNGATTVGQPPTNTQQFTLNLTLNAPTIMSERSELVQTGITVVTSSAGLSQTTPNTTVATQVSVRSRQSAAIAGIISKKSENQFGGPTGAGAIVTLNHGKSYTKSTNNYVLFVTPIIKSSASAGVEQVKKKFRFKD